MDSDRDKTIKTYADHVYPGKVEFYQKYDIVLVPENRGGAKINDVNGKSFYNCHCYDPETLWWQHEKLHRIVLKDYSKLELYGADRNRLESSFLEKACLVKENDTMDMTYQAFDQSRRATRDWINRVESRPAKKSLNPLFNLYWKKQNKKAGLFPE
jgi:hypothetical protein